MTGIDANAARAAYDEKEYFTEQNPYIERWEEFSRQFQKLVAKIRRFKPQGRLLDVGCSIGILLDAARRNGFDVQGVEVSAWASDFAREKGFDVVTGGLLDAKYRDKSFDVVIFNHVLEHLPNPIDVLQETKRILKDDGLLVIGVPNFGSYMASLKKEQWTSLQPDQHIWQFTRQTLGRVLARSGFSEVYFESKENHRLSWRRPESLLFLLVNMVARFRNNSEAMLVFARKSP